MWKAVGIGVTSVDYPRFASGASSRSAQALDDHRHPLPAADAHRLEADRLVLGREAVEQGCHDPGACHPERVSKSDRTTVDVELVPVDSELASARDDLSCKRLVQLDEVDVVDRHAC